MTIQRSLAYVVAIAGLLLLIGCPQPEVVLTGTDAYPPGTMQSFPGLAGVPNLDDDNDDGDVDWTERGAAEGDDERSAFFIEPEAFVGLKKDESLRLEIGGQVGDVRVYIEGVQILGEAEGDNLMSYDVVETEVRQEFSVEYKDMGAQASLTLRRLDGDGENLESDTIWLTASPLILNHHLQQTEHVWVMDVNGGGGFNNQQMIGVFEDVLDDQFTGFPATDYGWDVWIQDEVQFANLFDAEQRIDVVIDSIRDRELDPWAEDNFPGPADELVGVWGSGPPNSLDSFGNLEVSPPMVANGVNYPFGRVYFGATDSRYPNAELTDFLAEQKIQDPFNVDTAWLCVGHIDEYTSFVPDPTAPRGFRFVYADTGTAWEALEAAENTPMPRYSSAYGISDIDEMVNDNAIRFLNDDTQEDILDPVLDDFIEELELTEDEIIRLPSLFEEAGNCGQAALITGMVNLIVSNRGDQVDVFLGDPFTRNSNSSTSGQEDDVIIQAVLEMMPDTIDFHFVDNWNVYHLGLGEVHCGTNMTRTPDVDWWTVSGHLLEEQD